MYRHDIVWGIAEKCLSIVFMWRVMQLGSWTHSFSCSKFGKTFAVHLKESSHCSPHSQPSPPTLSHPPIPNLHSYPLSPSHSQPSPPIPLTLPLSNFTSYTPSYPRTPNLHLLPPLTHPHPTFTSYTLSPSHSQTSPPTPSHPSTPNLHLLPPLTRP